FAYLDRGFRLVGLRCRTGLGLRCFWLTRHLGSPDHELYDRYAASDHKERDRSHEEPRLPFDRGVVSGEGRQEMGQQHDVRMRLVKRAEFVVELYWFGAVVICAVTGRQDGAGGCGLKYEGGHP